MTDPHQTQTLSEISHLFLSGVRDMHQGNAPRPTRIPPPKQNVSIDMTPEEYAAAMRGESATSSPTPAAKEPSKIGPVSVVIASHLGDKLHDQAKAYARHLAATHSQRVGIIELDASLFRLYTVEKSLGSSAGDAPSEPANFEAHQLADALNEMNWDIDRWLVLVPNPRLPEARALLRQCGHWVLLCTGDHDGMVTAYRGLKGLNEGHRPRLSLAVLEADKSEAERIHNKLSGVCAQFLNWPVADYTCVTAVANVEAHAVLAWRPAYDKAAVAAGHQWKVAGDFLKRAKSDVIDDTPALSEEEAEFVAADDIDPATAHTPEVSSTSQSEIRNPQLDPPAVLHTITPAAAPAPVIDAAPEVIDLPDGDHAGIVPAVLQHGAGQLIECPVRPPMCPEARLAVTRDRRIVLLAVAREGLADLRSIGQAYRWLIENRPLISMAVPQLAIDPHQHPSLRLIVNHTDLSADVLQPMLQSSVVTVQSYRTLRWGPKTGLLLEAA